MRDAFDKIIKQQVDKHATPVDPQVIWQGIQKKRNLQKRKRRIGFFFLFLIGISTSSLFYVTKSKEIDLSKQQYHKQNLLAQSQPTLVSDLKKMPKQVTISEDLHVPKGLEKKVNENTVVTKVLVNNSNNSVSIPAKKVTTNNQRTIEQKVIEKFTPNSESDLTLTTPTLKSLLSPLIALPHLAIDQLAIASEPPILLRTIEPYETDNRGFRSLSIIGGAYKLNKTYTPNNQNQELQILRVKETTQPIDAYSFGMNIEYGITSRVSFSTGINYSRYYERFESVLRYLTDEDGTIQYGRFDDLGNAIYDLSSSALFFVNEQKIDDYNTYHFIDIPFSVNYQLPTSRLRTYLSVGGAYNIYQKPNGHSFDHNLAYTNLETNPPHRSSLSMFSSLAVELPLYAGLNFRTAARVMTRSLTTGRLDQRYLAYGIQAGLTYNWN